MRALLVAAALLCVVSAARAANPTAEELLKRSKLGQSVIVDTLTAEDEERTRLKTSFGVGMHAFGDEMILIEGSAYLDGNDGFYLGYGFWNSGDSHWRVLNAGWNELLSDITRIGLGIQYERVSITPEGVPETSDTRFGPHGWIEVGRPTGPAVRLEYSRDGASAAAHFRWNWNYHVGR